MRIWQKILVILLFPLLFEIIFVVALVVLLIRTEETENKFDRSKKVLVSFDDAENGILTATLALAPVKGEPPIKITTQFDSILESVNRCQRMIDETLDIHPQLQSAITEVPECFEHCKRFLRRAEKIYRDPLIPPLKRPKYIRAEFVGLVFEMRPILDEMHKAGEAIRNLEPQELERLRLYVGLVVSFGLMISLTASIFISRLLLGDIVTRLNVIQQNAFRLAAGQTLLAPVAGRDEIKELDMAFHRAANVISDARKKEFAILEKASDVIFSLDARNRFTTVAESALKSWHYSADDLLGRSLLSLLTAESEPRTARALQIAVDSNLEQIVEGQMICGDKTTRDIQWTISWQPVSKLFNCIAHDISERRLVERHKSELIATASHKINMPLSQVSESLRQIHLDKNLQSEPNLARMLARAEGNLERLTRLIQDLLDMEQMETGKMSLKVDRVEAKEICRTASDAVNALAVRAGVSVVLDGNNGLMIGDRRRLEQVLVNLLSNAIKFSPKGSSVELNIKTLPDYIEVSVRDHGPGIRESEQELIFERFFQTSVKPTTAVKSTGLGLSICKALIEAHKGTIGVESEFGSGSSFWIRIPVMQETRLAGGGA